MSNSSPAALKAQAKIRKQQEKENRHPKDGLTEKRSLSKRMLAIIFSIIFVIIPAILAYPAYFPRIAISQNGTVRSHDAMGTVFNVTNGPLPIRGVEAVCSAKITAPNNIKVDHLDLMNRPLGSFDVGQTKGLDCEHTAGGFTLGQSALTISIRYRPLLWPWKLTTEFSFEAERADDGTWVWRSV